MSEKITVQVERGTVLFRGEMREAFRLLGAPGVVWYAHDTKQQVCGARVASTFEPEET